MSSTQRFALVPSCALLVGEGPDAQHVTWQRCGKMPATLHGGEYLCAPHQARYATCGGCGRGETTAEDLTWDLDRDCMLCAPCASACPSCGRPGNGEPCAPYCPPKEEQP